MQRKKRLKIPRRNEIYISPDGGETVYKRPFGNYDPKNKVKV